MVTAPAICSFELIWGNPLVFLLVALGFALWIGFIAGALWREP
jgi:hypothetical protein